MSKPRSQLRQPFTLSVAPATISQINKWAGRKRGAAGKTVDKLTQHGAATGFVPPRVAK